jgi:hypothetical protein
VDLAYTKTLLRSASYVNRPYFEDHADLNVSRAHLYLNGIDTILERWNSHRSIQREHSAYGRLSTSKKESLYPVIAARHLERGETAFPFPNLSEFFGAESIRPHFCRSWKGSMVC